MSHAAKQRIYEQFARVGKALASPSRLELLDLLAQGERSVDALAREAELSVANASQHLQQLYAARLVETRREGQRIFYRLASPSVATLWHALRDTAQQQLAELDVVAREYLAGRDDFEPISRTELVKRLENGTVTLIDVRPVEEFEQGHIEGAVSVPLDQVKEWAKTAPRRRQVVAYCRGPYCVYALKALAELRKRGITGLRSEDGVAEWRAAGLPVEAGGAS
jgi:rhodanese-related sulfurtransferase/DNA-binding MarR family transcriptional regulator